MKDVSFAGPIPEVYARRLVPLLFEPYALDLAARVAESAPRDVLETAAGTGVVTRALRARLPDTRLVATDLNQAMLDQARAHGAAPARVVWQAADALALPFEAASFDAVVCQFGTMFFSDKVAGHREARRVLRPGGRLFFSVWAELAANDFARTVHEAVAEVFPGDPPRFIARVPHGYAEPDAIRADLEGAGFEDIAIETVEARSHAESARDAALAFCQGTPLRAEIEARDAAKLDEATDCAAEALAKRFGTHAIEGRLRAFVATARR
ncbi:ubiquinone/menaquinone biosynthesis methyltransferase [Aureimonas endophytica]|uniref:Ubiquinone/menaquinone biosynthesis methyltransferase n=1 Tax=Aureimonas endophytica TaxID=2027858 RepID=A0A916ZGX7_9HYPH|nr:methyltransferase domain-containing protein [Aureimonas endophytica]GGD97255.1 ubiquinone/menaquinone biosynthesis methyltransferase [Aureimonas endophytica]